MLCCQYPPNINGSPLLFLAKGNMTPTAEMNFYCDPEAAHVTLTQINCPIKLLCWESCLRCPFSWVSIIIREWLTMVIKGIIYGGAGAVEKVGHRI